jgi:hypothetical protein
MALVFAENIPLVEPVPIEDELCSGLARIEDVGGIAARFVLYHVQTLYEVGATAFVVKRKIILPYEAIPPSIEMTVGYMARRSGERLVHLVTPSRDATVSPSCSGHAGPSSEPEAH